MKLLRRPGVAVMVLLLIGAAAFALTPREHRSNERVERTFTLDIDFEMVGRVLQRRDTATTIMETAGTSEFVSLDWDDTDLGFQGFAIDAEGRPKLDLKVKRTGKLRVRVLNDDLGPTEITLGQEVEVDPTFIASRLRLREGTDRLLGYDMDVRFEPVVDRSVDNAATTVTMSLRQEVATSLPWLFTSVADRRVRESAEATLAAQEGAIREVAAKVRDTIAAEDAANGGPPGPLKKLLRGLLNR